MHKLDEAERQMASPGPVLVSWGQTRKGARALAGLRSQRVGY
jgi:hypothetical protein